MYILLCCVAYNCTVHGADLTYISLLVIFCIIVYVMNKTLNLEPQEALATDASQSISYKELVFSL